jgi:Spy/CpxP family protein refolding chaperone
MMKRTSKYFVIVFLASLGMVLLMTKIAYLQENQPFGHPAGPKGFIAEPGFKEIGSVLDLNDEQRKELKKVMKSHRRESRNELIDKVAPILNSDQQAKLQEIKSDLNQDKMPRILIANRIDRLNERLNLSAGQKDQLTSIFNEFGDKVIQLGNNELERDQLRESMQEYRDELQAQLETVLAPEQMDELRDMHREKRGKFGRRIGYKNQNQRLQKALSKLDLSPEQEIEIKSIVDESRQAVQQKMQKITDEDERRELMREHRQNTANEIEAVLTPEQKEKFDAMKKELKGKRQGRQF